jgi:hypothetical protein
MTPRSEVSSQGYTTMVGIGGAALAAAIRRSYLLGERAFTVSTGMAFMFPPDLSD